MNNTTTPYSNNYDIDNVDVDWSIFVIIIFCLPVLIIGIMSICYSYSYWKKNIKYPSDTEQSRQDDRKYSRPSCMCYYYCFPCNFLIDKK